MSKNTAIGIDLGTTYSCVGVYENGNVTIIANDQGNRTTPSYVSFSDTERLIGDAAKNGANSNPKNTIYDTKRLIGLLFGDLTVQRDMKHFSFDVIDVNDKPMIQVKVGGVDTTFSPEQIASMILQKMKNVAEDYIGSPVTDAVITVPAYFNDAQRQATKDAGTIAGLNVLRIINEPTAAAVAYGLQQKTEGEHNILVYDLGGGTFDVSVLTIEDGLFEVKSTAGNTHLGGSDFDQLITDYLLEEFLRKNRGAVTREDITERSMRKLRTQAERAKRTLSSATVAQVEADSLCNGIDFNTTLTRARFEELCKHLFRETLDSVQKALKDAGMAKTQINEVVLVGGSTRIPQVQKILSDFFGGKELCKSINPDEAVAYGAAVQAAILSGKATGVAGDMVLLDVTPLSLGIETSGQFMTNIIDRNQSIPCHKTQIFTTHQDNQPAVTIRVFEGERKFTKDNNLLGQFNLEGIPPARAGEPQVEVSFDMDSNGILTVSAVEKTTNKTQTIKIEGSNGRLSKEDIERMIDEAKNFEEQDRINVERVEAKNRLEQTILKTKGLLEEKENKEYLDALDDQTECRVALDLLESMDRWLREHQDGSRSEYDQKLTELTGGFETLKKQLPKSGAMPGMPGMGGMPGMPEMSPEQMAQFQEMMKDPKKMEEMMKDMNIGSPGGGAVDDPTDDTDVKQPSVEDVD